MITSREQRRYQRHIMLPEIGLEGQTKLKEARILVVGAGGLGCPALQYLTAAGLGNIGIIDYDVVDEGNLQRQVLYGTYDIGKLKSIIAKNQMDRLNHMVNIDIRNIRIDHENVLNLLKGYQLVLDATDNYQTRYILSDACVVAGIPLVHGSIHRFEGQITVFNYKGGPTYRCLYPEPPNKLEAPPAAQSGILGVLPGIIGCYMANETIKVILNIGEVLSGTMLVINILENRFHHIRIPVNEENRKIKKLANPDL